MLLPATMLARRDDWAVMIGRALELKAAQVGAAADCGGGGGALDGARLAVRFAVVAEKVQTHLTRRTLWLDAGLVRLEPSGSWFADAVAAVAAAGGAAAQRLGIGCRPDAEVVACDLVSEVNPPPTPSRARS